MRLVAFMVTYGRPVGADLMSGVLLRDLAARGHDVTVYVDILPEPLEDEGVKVLPRGYFDLHKRPAADVLYCHADFGALPWTVKRAYDLPLVYVAHNVSPTTAWKLDNFPPDLVIWNSESTRNAFGRTDGIVVRPPMRFLNAPTSHGEHVTLVNRTLDKGVETFAAVLQDLNLDNPPPFLAVSGGYGDQVEIAGATTLPLVTPERMSVDVWQETKVFLCPSAYESWGMAAIEALCHGVPVVAHPTPGLVEALGTAGTFVDRDNHEAWTQATRDLLTDPKIYAAARRRARSRVKALVALQAADLDTLDASLSALA